MQSQNAKIKWIQTPDGSQTLYHTEYDETYHSKQGAYSESQHVYLNPILPLIDDLQIVTVLDVGFGLGINWLVWVEWALQTGRTLRIHSLEKQADILTIPNPAVPCDQKLKMHLSDYKLNQSLVTPQVKAQMHLDEALASLDSLHQQDLQFDVVLQDPFSPQKNPDCWNEDYFKSLNQCLNKRCVVASYSVAKVGCENLQNIGFEIEKLKGFAGKRNQLLAKRV